MPSNIPFTIFHTSDIHGRYEKLAKLYTVLNRERNLAKQDGRLVLNFDAGDASDRLVPFCSLTKGAAFSHIVNAMGIDAQTVGNDISLPYGISALSEYASRCNFPVLAANLRDKNGPLPEHITQRTCLDVGHGIKFGVFGLTAPWGTSYEAFGLHLPDTKDIIIEEVNALKAAGADIIIFLSHLGITDDFELLFGIPEIDLVLGGHSHLLASGGMTNGQGLPFSLPGQYAEHLGKVEFEYDPAEKKLVDITVSTISIPKDIEPDPDLLRAIEKAKEEAENEERRYVGQTNYTLPLDYENQCAIGQLGADALRVRFQADIAIIMAGAFHNHIEAGEVSLGSLNKATFSAANPYLSMITGKEIREGLEKCLDPEVINYYHHGLRGAPVGFPQISGLSIEYSPDNRLGEKIGSIVIGSEPLLDEKEYKIAHTDIELSKRFGCIGRQEHQVVKHDPEIILRDVIERYFKDNSPLNMQLENRWKVTQKVVK